MEDRDLRRRRREAVVIHDGEGSVGRDDVYMRDVEGLMSSEQRTDGLERRESEDLLGEFMLAV